MVRYTFGFAYTAAKLQYVPLFNTVENVDITPFYFTNR